MSIMKNRILVDSAELFENLGFKKVTMDRIAKHLRISKKTIYQFYPSRNHLITDYVNLKCSDVNRQLGSSTIIDPVEGLRNIDKVIYDSFSKMNQLVINDLTKYYPKEEIIVQSFKEQIRHQVMSMLEKGKDARLFRSSIDTSILSKLRITEMEYIYNCNHMFTDKHLRKIQYQLFEHFIQGILCPK